MGTAATARWIRTSEAPTRSPRPPGTSRSPARQPLAITNCLNFGNPERPEVMWQFSEAVRGMRGRVPRARHPGDGRQRELLQRVRWLGDLADARSSACSGSLADYRLRLPSGFPSPGLAVYLLGSRSPSSVGPSSPRPCSAWSAARRRHSTSRPSAGSRTCCRRPPPRDLLASAHDCSDGGCGDRARGVRDPRRARLRRHGRRATCRHTFSCSASPRRGSWSPWRRNGKARSAGSRRPAA